MRINFLINWSGDTPGRTLISWPVFRELTAAVLIVTLLAISPLVLAARQLTTVTLHNADPLQMVQVIKQYLSRGSSVQSYQNQLIINATPQEQKKIRALLKQLDAQGQTLWIALRVGEQAQGLGQAASITIPPVVISKKGIQTITRSTVTIKQRGFSSSSQQRQGVRATEGVAAYISSGVSVPLNISSNDSSVYAQQIHEVNSGFFATAWVDGNTVTLDLDQRNDQLQGDLISTQQIQSRVSGPVGEWIPVGMLMEGNNFTAREIGGRKMTGQNKSTTIYIKVSVE